MIKHKAFLGSLPIYDINIHIWNIRINIQQMYVIMDIVNGVIYCGIIQSNH